MSTISVFWSFVVVVWNLKQMVNEHSNDFEMKKIFFKWKNEWIGWKSAKGGTRVWTGDLSICSRMLYHWAIPPSVERLMLIQSINTCLRLYKTKLYNTKLLLYKVAIFKSTYSNNFIEFLLLTHIYIIQ